MPATVEEAKSQTEQHEHAEFLPRPVSAAMPLVAEAAGTQTTGCLPAPSEPAPPARTLRHIGTSTDLSGPCNDDTSGEEQELRRERSAAVSADCMSSQGARLAHAFGARDALAARAFLSTGPLRQTQVTAGWLGFLMTSACVLYPAAP